MIGMAQENTTAFRSKQEKTMDEFKKMLEGFATYLSRNTDQMVSDLKNMILNNSTAYSAYRRKLLQFFTLQTDE